MKTELEISKTLNYLEQVKQGKQENDIETLNDVDKAMDVLRWVLGQPDEDGLPTCFGLFLDALEL